MQAVQHTQHDCLINVSGICMLKVFFFTDITETLFKFNDRKDKDFREKVNSGYKPTCNHLEYQIFESHSGRGKFSFNFEQNDENISYVVDYQHTNTYNGKVEVSTVQNKSKG